MTSGCDHVANDERVSWLLQLELPDGAAGVVNRELQSESPTREWCCNDEEEARNGHKEREEEEPALARNDLIHAVHQQLSARLPQNLDLLDQRRRDMAMRNEADGSARATSRVSG